MSANFNPAIDDPRPAISPFEDLSNGTSDPFYDSFTFEEIDMPCGAFADVRVATVRDIQSGQEMKVAVKILRQAGDTQITPEEKDPNAIKRHLNREARVWKDLKHPNILEFLCLDWQHGRFNLPAFVSPYCENGTVVRYLKDNPTVDRLSIIKGVAQGLEYLHNKDMVHGDVKPTNILVDTHGQPVLCDFGRSKILTCSGFTATSFAGSARYQAPELFQEEKPGESPKLTKAADVYAFAISSYEIWANHKAYNEFGNDGAIVLHVTTRGARPRRPNPPLSHDEIIWPLLERCWQKEEADRPLISKVVDDL